MPNRLHKIQIIITLCLLAQMLLSFQLWLPTTRSFPIIPAFDFLPLQNPITIPHLFVGTFTFAMILWLFLKEHLGLWLLVIIFAVLTVLEDINRLQVWFYQLVIMLALIGGERRLGRDAVVGNLQFILIAIYVWSGFNKLGVYYNEDTFPWLMEAITPLKSLGQFRFLAIASALFEIALGMGLIFDKTRRLTCYLVLLFHLFILLALGPFGHNWNQVVWPWNICQILLVFYLFYKTEFIKPFKLVKMAPISAIILLLFGLMPAFNIVDKWPDQLSFKMYSGAYSECVLFAPDKDGACLPNHKDIHVGQSPENTTEYSLILDDWSLSELGVTPFINLRFYKRLGVDFCNCLENDAKAGIELLTVDRWNRANEGYHRLPCSDLMDQK